MVMQTDIINLLNSRDTSLRYITQEKDDKLCSNVRKFMKKPVVENVFLAFIIINSIMICIGTFEFITEHEKG